jgi:hypothetical protein
MAEYRNPPLLKAQPADGDVMQYDAASDTWNPVTLGSLPAAVIPQTHIAAEAAPAAVTTGDLATTAATQTTPWGFASEAQAEAIATEFNKAVTDITALQSEVAANRTLVNTLLTELQTAGILAAS